MFVECRKAVIDQVANLLLSDLFFTHRPIHGASFMPPNYSMVYTCACLSPGFLPRYSRILGFVSGETQLEAEAEDQVDSVR